MSLFNQYIERYRRVEEEYSLEEFLAICKQDRIAYASASERMLAAIGEAELVDTRQDPRLSRIFSNKVIKVYPAFKDFFGMEDTIEQIVSYFRHAAQGLEERKQILYLLGPVGGGKSLWVSPEGRDPYLRQGMQAVQNHRSDSPFVVSGHPSTLGPATARRRRKLPR